MSFKVQTFYPEAGMFLNTNHVSNDLDELKRLVGSETFAGFKVRIVNEGGSVVFEPPVRQRSGYPSVSDIGQMLGVPVIDDLEHFLTSNDDVDA